MPDHYVIPFLALTVEEAPAADNAAFNANIGINGTFSQFLRMNVGQAWRGVLTDMYVFCDSQNDRAFDLFIVEAAIPNDQEQAARCIFRSDETPLGAAGIIDATLESFTGYNIPFSLNQTGAIYYSLFSAAGAFGDCFGRIMFRGLAYF